MRYISRFHDFQITPAVKFLILISVFIWFFLVVVSQQYFLSSPIIFEWFGLSPHSILSRGWVWQFLTYIFIHSPGIFHPLLNMFILYMFGSELERLWGSRFFLIYYLFCGVGAGLLYLISLGIWTAVFDGPVNIFQRPVIGASGAIFGLLLAYGIIYGERIIYFMMIFPLKARHFTMIIAGIELVSVLNHGLGSPVANLAHLGGLVSGLIFLKCRKVFQNIHVRRWKRFQGRSHLRVVNDNNETRY